VQLVFKIFNLCGHDPHRTDRRHVIARPRFALYSASRGKNSRSRDVAVNVWHACMSTEHPRFLVLRGRCPLVVMYGIRLSLPLISERIIRLVDWVLHHSPIAVDCSALSY